MKNTTPFVSIAGTSLDELYGPRVDACHYLRDALRRLIDAGPNGRDYPNHQHLADALALHRKRQEIIKSLIDDISAEIEEIVNQ